MKRRIVIYGLVILIGLNCRADAVEKPRVLELYTQCMKSALEMNEVSLQPGGYIRFVCHGDLAKTFYERLGDYDYKAVEAERQKSTVLNRSFDPPDQCWEKIKNPDGSAADEFGCDLNFHASGTLFQQESKAEK